MLRDYYDPMYDYQLNRYPQPFVMQGQAVEIEGYLTNLSSR